VKKLFNIIKIVLKFFALIITIPFVVISLLFGDSNNFAWWLEEFEILKREFTCL